MTPNQNHASRLLYAATWRSISELDRESFLAGAEALAAADKTMQGRWRLRRHFGQAYLIPVDRCKEWIDWCENREPGEHTAIVPEWAKPVRDDVVITGVELP